MAVDPATRSVQDFSHERSLLVENAKTLYQGLCSLCSSLSKSLPSLVVALLIKAYIMLVYYDSMYIYYNIPEITFLSCLLYLCFY